MSEEEIIDEINFCNEGEYITREHYQAIQGLLDLYQTEKIGNANLQILLDEEKEKNNNILGLIFEYGQIDGEHHKTWVIDQIVRILTGNDYDKWVQHYEYDEETGEDYTWDIGIAP